MPPESPRRSVGRPADERLGPVILAATLDLLDELGYARLTTAEVARRAGVSTATIYRRWDSKRVLVLAAAQQLADAADDPVDTGSLVGDLERLRRHKQRIFTPRIARTLLVLMGEALHDAELAEVIRTGVHEPTEQHVREVLERAVARGERPPRIDAATVTRLVLGAVLADATTARDAPANASDEAPNVSGPTNAPRPTKAPGSTNTPGPTNGTRSATALDALFDLIADEAAPGADAATPVPGVAPGA